MVDVCSLVYVRFPRRKQSMNEREKNIFFLLDAFFLILFAVAHVSVRNHFNRTMLMDFDLKEVFSILDENKEGLISLRRLIDVANNYYSDAEVIIVLNKFFLFEIDVDARLFFSSFKQLARITKALDPKNTGFINFEQFCHGISQISSLQGVPLKEVASDLSRLSRENSLTEDADQRSLVNVC